ncbi:kinase-like domain-containing protein [Scheffersomyces xylosifermentans]|uniref:kinase-like domain-containing protein n=1 Tax=Scheffersomyces xylosifermentans TaxID=1304137 RepID=UPI00315D8273
MFTINPASISPTNTGSSTSGSGQNLPDNYKLISVLGEGAFSTVYKAIDTKQNDLTVAIKIINKANLTSKQFHNIKNEIQIMKKAGSQHHPNILKLLHSINTADHCFLILEYCNGGEIFNKIIEYTYFSERLSRHVFKQLVSAIDHLHKNGIVHRDIKPENLLFLKIPYVARPTEEFKSALRKSDDDSKVDEGDFQTNIGGGTIGLIKLADFGLAKQLVSKVNSSTNLKTPCGTAGYTAPEVITCNSEDGTKKKLFFNNTSKKNYYSKAVDIWSLGCFLYTILCGFPPFYDDNSNDLTMKIINGDFVFLKPWWDEISGEAKDLITRMLNTNPEERITIEEIWQHPWVRQGSGTPYPHQQQQQEEEIVSQHYFEVVEQKYEVMHIEDTGSTESVNDFLPMALPNQPLLSPRAHAIKKVFGNHAMLGSIEDEVTEESDERNVQFSDDEEEFDDSEQIAAEDAHHRVYPKSPNPISLNFKDVFKIDKNALSSTVMPYSDDEEEGTDEDEGSNDEESEIDDEVKSLNTAKFAGNKSKSANSSSENDQDYQTRSSSIISGMNGDFKFTLNLNESNLLSRRSLISFL